MLMLLAQGSLTTTYKYALLLSIMDICLEGAGKGLPPTTITTRQLSERMVDIYWHHTDIFDKSVLYQGTNRHGTKAHRSQAGILTEISNLREAVKVHSADSSPFKARRNNQKRFEQMLDEVEWILIKQPVPRLQIIGSQEDRFLYEIAWKVEGRSSTPTLIGETRAIPRASLKTGAFDNRLQLKPGVAENLIQLAPVLRPLIQHQWTTMVARINALPESKLEDHLFGRDRISLQAIHQGLYDLQKGQCFYCSKKSRLKETQVDHFLPWSRYPDDNLCNLVIADTSCNNNKTDFLADTSHVLNWKNRDFNALSQLAAQKTWPWTPKRTFSTALMVYSRLTPGLRLWRSGKDLIIPSQLELLQTQLQERLDALVE
jgi:5-methylcytosine-specific restriction endonuclease McrA